MNDNNLKYNRITWWVDVKSSEKKSLGWAFLYVFALFLAYYILRPIREELGVAGGVDNLPWLFTGTLLAMIALNPIYSFLVKRWTRERFIKITYRFFMANLLGFMLLLMFASPSQNIWIGRAFFIWISVFNLFVVSVFWSLIVDIFDASQGKRLFGFIAAGATLGGIVGSAATSVLVEIIGQNWLLLVAILLLEVAVQASQILSRFKVKEFVQGEGENTQSSIVGGGVLTGLANTFRSPYLMGIAFFMLFNSITSTFLYFQQAAIAEANFTDRESRTAFFANIDLWVNAFTLIFQLFLAGRLIKWLGVAIVLGSLPFVSIIGFTALAIYPSITMLLVAQISRRVSNFGLSRPTREILFTIVSREDRYKAKNFIDTVVYRGGDQVGSWSYTGLLSHGLGVGGMAIVAIPISVVWLLLSLWLGKSSVLSKENKDISI